MDTLPDLETFALFRSPDRTPDLDRIEAVLTRSERIAVGLAEKFPANAVFAAHLATTRRGLARLAEARAALERGDRHRLDDIAAELAGLFTSQGRADRLPGLGLLPE